jgi:hypothetical protein
MNIHITRSCKTLTFMFALTFGGTAALAGPAHHGVHGVYPLAGDSLSWLEQKATAKNGSADDVFGYAVAVSGSVAAIGATGANNGEGAVYIFTPTDGRWSYDQTLAASDAAAGDAFGQSVAIVGNVIIVGAPYANGSEGAAYVFNQSAGSWSQTDKLTPNDGESNYNFGWSIAMSGNRAIVSAPVAPVEDNPLAGAAYIFSRSEGSWSQDQKLTADDPVAFADFGYSVALDGATALIGSSGLNSYFGAAYVFDESGGEWTQTAQLTPTDGTTLEFFGISVALRGATALVGAYYQDIGSNSHQGTAYVFTKSSGVWSQSQKLTANDGASGDRFGLSVALDDSEALVGAYYADVDGHEEQGATYLFKKMGGAWSQMQKFTASDGHAEDNFGNAVAISKNTALVGAFGATVDGNGGAGAAYFYGGSKLDLAVSVPQTVVQGEQYTSQTIATNSSSAASPAVTATVSVPAAASFVSATATQGNCNEASGVVACDFGQIEGNAGTATADVTLKATGSPGTTIENTASIAKATPALTASAPTEIGETSSCEPGYTEFDGHLDAGEQFLSDPIEVNEAGQKYVDLTAPASFKFVGVTQTRYGEHTYIYRKHHGHRWGAAGSYQVGVRAGDTGGDYTLCVQLNPAQ